jgi:hypothetical protein
MPAENEVTQPNKLTEDAIRFKGEYYSLGSKQVLIFALHSDAASIGDIRKAFEVYTHETLAGYTRHERRIDSVLGEDKEVEIEKLKNYYETDKKETYEVMTHIIDSLKSREVKNEEERSQITDVIKIADAFRTNNPIIQDSINAFREATNYSAVDKLVGALNSLIHVTVAPSSSSLEYHQGETQRLWVLELSVNSPIMSDAVFKDLSKNLGFISEKTRAISENNSDFKFQIDKILEGIDNTKEIIEKRNERKKSGAVDNYFGENIAAVAPMDLPRAQNNSVNLVTLSA